MVSRFVHNLSRESEFAEEAAEAAPDLRSQKTFLRGSCHFGYIVNSAGTNQIQGGETHTALIGRELDCPRLIESMYFNHWFTVK